MRSDLDEPVALRSGPRWRRQLALMPVALLFLIPLLWMISTSLKRHDQVFTWPPVLIPNPAQWHNFLDVLVKDGFGRYLLNTIALSTVVTVGTLFSATLTAYSLARVDWKWRNAAFLLVISTMLLPDFVTIIPLFSMYQKLGLVGGVPGFLPLVLPAWFGKAYFIFLMRQFMLGIPTELSDAARMDGCSELGILLRIVLPLCRPALLSVALFSIIATWSDVLQPLVYLRDEKYFTVSLGLAQFQGRYVTQWEQMLAAASVTAVPVLIVFVLAQKKFVRGISTTGIK
ncbi:carbohydrate ABC transporter permease [Dactylosporangium siamense]|uniref:Sugar ABC transporter permease n=1 Tax=Dactylosporangium siamense TaxID=685454 RepID=A0A919PUV0_9ACTN|nr:carbohydrate ABC transporter permease [Dactylosporangium siamense]GIG50132.1 sugar ABC transporter permease [Dactylosporangium siamense]